MIKESNKSQIPITKIPFEGVHKDLLIRLVKTLDKMAQLHEEVKNKMAQVIQWKNELKSLINEFVANGSSAVDIKNLDESVTTYTSLLNKVLHELTGEITFFSRFISETPPAEIEVAGNNINLNATQILENKIASMKKNARVMQRDLQVSFSRYEHGLEGQIKQLNLARKLKIMNTATD